MCPAPDRARRKTGDYTEINMGGTSAKTADGESPDADGDKLTANQMTTIVVPGTERATLVTWDITNYLNDTNFNENAQVMYQYDQDGKEKASYVYGEVDSRISGDLTKEAVKYTEQKAGDYSYLYDGQGNVAETVLSGSVAESYSYDPFGEMTAEGKEGRAKTPLEAQNDNGLSDNDVLSCSLFWLCFLLAAHSDTRLTAVIAGKECQGVIARRHLFCCRGGQRFQRCHLIAIFLPVHGLQRHLIAGL